MYVRETTQEVKEVNIHVLPGFPQKIHVIHPENFSEPVPVENGSSFMITCQLHDQDGNTVTQFAQNEEIRCSVS